MSGCLPAGRLPLYATPRDRGVLMSSIFDGVLYWLLVLFSFFVVKGRGTKYS